MTTMNQYGRMNQLLLLVVAIFTVVNHYCTLTEGRIHKTKYPRGTSTQRQQQELAEEEAYYESILIRGSGQMQSNYDAFEFNNEENGFAYEERRLKSSKSGTITKGTMASGTMGTMTSGTMGTMASGTMGTMVSGTMTSMASGTMTSMASGTMTSMASGTMTSMASGGTMKSTGKSSRRRGRRRAEERQRYRL